jgi:beta-lactamase regulating signal transducer with metallopeptidase domain
MQALVETALSNALVASALALVAFAVSRWRRPALAHGLWLLVLVKLITPPLVPIYLPPMAAERTTQVDRAETGSPGVDFASISLDDLAAIVAMEENAAENSAKVDEARSPMPVASNWWDALVPIWIAGAFAWLGCTGWSVARFRRQFRSARRAPAAIQGEARRLAERLGLARPPEVWLVSGTVSPMIWSIGAATRLLFPAGLLDRLDAEQRAALLLHELAHVRRCDHWVRILELFVVALYWWHPVVWWARCELREAEEQCCDAWVVWASGGDGHVYSRALLEAVAFVSRTRCPLPAVASGIGHVYHLRRRLTMIVGANTPRSLSAAGWLVLAGLALFLLPLAARAQVPAKHGESESAREIKVLKEKLRSLEDQQALRADEDILVELVIDDDKGPSGDEKTMKAIADLKKQIAAKRAELQDLEAKMQKLVSGMEGKKAGRAKGDGVKVKVKELKDLKDGITIELDQKAVKQFDEAIQKDMKELQERLKQIPKGAIILKDLKGIEIDVMSLDDLKKQLGELKGKNLDELKKQLGELKGKNLDDLKKQIAEMKGLGEKQAQEFKKAIEMKEFERAKALKAEAEARAKIKPDKTEDFDARLDRLMKEIQELRREIRRGKDKQVQ